MRIFDAYNGVALDRLAHDDYGIQRRHAESDAHFRMRLKQTIGMGIGVVTLGPLKLFEQRDALRVYNLLLLACPGAVIRSVDQHDQRYVPRRPLHVRDALEQIIHGAQNQTWMAGTTEQVIHELAEKLKLEGVLVDGVQLSSGQYTKAWVNKDALEVWYVASCLVLDDDDDDDGELPGLGR